MLDHTEGPSHDQVVIHDHVYLLFIFFQVVFVRLVVNLSDIVQHAPEVEAHLARHVEDGDFQTVGLDVILETLRIHSGGLHVHLIGDDGVRA